MGLLSVNSTKWKLYALSLLPRRRPTFEHFLVSLVNNFNLSLQLLSLLHYHTVTLKEHVFHPFSVPRLEYTTTGIKKAESEKLGRQVLIQQESIKTNTMDTASELVLPQLRQSKAWKILLWRLLANQWEGTAYYPFRHLQKLMLTLCLWDVFSILNPADPLASPIFRQNKHL